MRMIVEGFIDVLELGLEKEGQMVVSGSTMILSNNGNLS